MIKNIVFDMGNVLLDYNPNVILDKVCENEAEKEIIFKELFLGEEWIQGDRGEITNAERFDGVSKRVPEYLHDKLRECVDYWDICMLPVAGAQEFVQTMRDKGYGLYVLSNACTKFYEYFPKHYPLHIFDGVVVSSDIHMIKPDRKIYDYLFNKYDLNPAECFFIDDRNENVAAAKKAGMSGIVFQNNYDEIRKILGIAST